VEPRKQEARERAGVVCMITNKGVPENQAGREKQKKLNILFIIQACCKIASLLAIIITTTIVYFTRVFLFSIIQTIYTYSK
jgi:hypothetical protein